MIELDNNKQTFTMTSNPGYFWCCETTEVLTYSDIGAWHCDVTGDSVNGSSLYALSVDTNTGREINLGIKDFYGPAHNFLNILKKHVGVGGSTSPLESYALSDASRSAIGSVPVANAIAVVSTHSAHPVANASVAQVTCNMCGSIVPSSSKFCSNCGGQISTAPSEDPNA